MEKLSVLTASLFLIGGISWFFFGKKKEDSSPAEESIRKKENIELDISGMHCAGCAAGIEGTLRNLPGIISVSVNFATSKGYIEYDATKITKEDIIDRIRQLGYDASLNLEEFEKKRKG
ncbi:MAG TPA: heavy-metal-associated domain-containing protein [Persephonella sp.]|uniref:Copper-transporting atpase Ran1 (Protein responsive toantagonist 1) n=1 Tax=Persephonella marina (strain DSM 14350 / EX-H1) TaxID=123214 RepID=C0QTW7_PERMH|nr:MULTISPECIES: heavy metal-associated domain-containing protein [Persephonella]ACO04873.1 copper-transporting atpase Ran1 (protein responsive toantagonist 1) [Persephonella marina EX-H1]HCB70251.1 heavy-metal-associated domain-containing protein [Persephonella sp.]